MSIRPHIKLTKAVNACGQNWNWIKIEYIISNVSRFNLRKRLVATVSIRTFIFTTSTSCELQKSLQNKAYQWETEYITSPFIIPISVSINTFATRTTITRSCLPPKTVTIWVPAVFISIRICTNHRLQDILTGMGIRFYILDSRF